MRGEARRSGTRNRSKPKPTPESWWTPAALAGRDGRWGNGMLAWKDGCAKWSRPARSQIGGAAKRAAPLMTGSI